MLNENPSQIFTLSFSCSELSRRSFAKHFEGQLLNSHVNKSQGHLRKLKFLASDDDNANITTKLRVNFKNSLFEFSLPLKYTKSLRNNKQPTTPHAHLQI